MSLPPGFRFYPTDVELVKYYLKRKILGKKLQFEAIAEINICKYAPWDLPGKDRPILYNDQTIGMVKTLVFHLGHAPKGERTDWVMHEFRILDKELADDVQATFVLCKVFKKAGLGPKNGAQYGAPFNEKEWDTDDDDVGTRAKSLLTSESVPQSAVAHNSSNSFVTRMFMETGTSTKSPMLPEGLPLSAVAHDNSNSVVTSNFFQGSTSTESVPPPSKSLLAHHNCNSAVPNMLVQDSTSTGPLPELGPQKAMALVDDAPPPAGEGADIDSLLAMFREDYPPLLFDQNGFDQSGDAGYMELDDIFGGLENLDGWGGAEPTV